MLLLIELSGYKVAPGSVGATNGRILPNPRLKDDKLVKALLASDQMRTIMNRGNNSVAVFDPILSELLAKIQNSAIYRSYSRQKTDDLKENARFWNVVLETIVESDASFGEIARKMEGFTNVGYERAFDMARKSISAFSESRALVTESRNSLTHSFEKAYELYHRLLWMMVELTDMQDRRLDNAKHKYVPTAEDLNPDMRMVDNAFIARLRNNAKLAEFIEKNPEDNTLDNEVLLRRLLDNILSSSIYTEYMAAPATDYEADCEFWRKVFRTIILPSDELAEALEAKSVYWNDDIDIMGEFVLKTIKRFASAGEEGDVELLPMFKDEVDRRFGPELFNDSVKNTDNYRATIQRFVSKSWEMERLAFMDIVILTVAMAELLNFPEIPLAVTVNEYVEIANCYSTAKSGQFVNGMLSAIIRELQEEGTLLKR